MELAQGDQRGARKGYGRDVHRHREQRTAVKGARNSERFEADRMRQDDRCADHRAARGGMQAATRRRKGKARRGCQGGYQERQRNAQRTVREGHTPLIGAHREKMRGPDGRSRARACQHQPESARPAPLVARMGMRVDRGKKSGCSDKRGKQRNPKIELVQANPYCPAHGNPSALPQALVARVVQDTVNRSREIRDQTAPWLFSIRSHIATVKIQKSIIIYTSCWT